MPLELGAWKSTTDMAREALQGIGQTRGKEDFKLYGADHNRATSLREPLTPVLILQQFIKLNIDASVFSEMLVLVSSFKPTHFKIQ